MTDINAEEKKLRSFRSLDNSKQLGLVTGSDIRQSVSTIVDRMYMTGYNQQIGEIRDATDEIMQLFQDQTTTLLNRMTKTTNMHDTSSKYVEGYMDAMHIIYDELRELNNIKAERRK